MSSRAGRIVPFLAASVALHAVVLVTTHPQRLSIAPAPAGGAHGVSVRLVAAGEPASKKTRENAVRSTSQRRTTAKPESSAEIKRTGTQTKTARPATAPAPTPSHANTVITKAETSAELATESRREMPTQTLARTTKPAPAPAPTDRNEERPETNAVSESKHEPGPNHKPQPERSRTLARAGGEHAPKAHDANAGDGGTAATSAHARRARSEVATRLARYFRYPRLARRQGWEGRVVLAFRIAPDGRVLDIRVAQSSGRAILDQAAVQALQQVERIPSLTQSGLHESLALEIPIVYRLRAA